MMILLYIRGDVSEVIYQLEASLRVIEIFSSVNKNYFVEVDSSVMFLLRNTSQV